MANCLCSAFSLAVSAAVGIMFTPTHDSFRAAVLAKLRGLFDAWRLWYWQVKVFKDR